MCIGKLDLSAQHLLRIDLAVEMIVGVNFAIPLTVLSDGSRKIFAEINLLFQNRDVSKRASVIQRSMALTHGD